MPKTLMVSGKRYTFRDGSRAKSYVIKMARKFRNEGYSAFINYEPESVLKWKVYIRKKKR